MKRFTMVILLALTLCGVARAQAATVNLSWTAPGDDGNVGTAAAYDVRYSTANITEANWAAASQVTGEPAPKIAGSAESFSFPLTVVNGTTYYFAIKARDEANNWSALSNVVSVNIDSAPPGTIVTVTVTVSIP